MATTALGDMAATRYFDWIITTPTMLLTTIIYFKYQENLENSSKKKLTFWNFVKEHKKDILIIFLSNFLMLVFGYLGEVQVIRMDVSLTLGFIFFAYTFYIIYSKFAVNSKQSVKMFYFILFIWSLYGKSYLA